MPLSGGTRLGSYEILSALGAGGMGEVYRGRDTRLDRDVAIKILPEAFAADAERVARFEREAKILASLNHSHIAAIYGLEDAEGVTALVMELVEGEDLAQRLARGSIPLDEALPIAKQIAEALEAAHEHGIIHRDVKPANIKVRADGTVKVLDFGLAKAFGPTGSPNPNPTSSSTISMRATQPGVILGTAAYMAPEQARGRVVAKRADIWAFGCVLFEMLAGTRAFKRGDVTDTIVAVVSKDPDWQALPAAASRVRPLLARCLKKRPEAAAAGDRRRASPDRRSDQRYVRGFCGDWCACGEAVSPRGIGGDCGLGRRRTDWRTRGVGPDQQELPGIANLRQPFFSPDSRWIGFFEGTTLKKVAVTGGSVLTIYPNVAVPRGASWGDDNSIVFATMDISSGLLRVSASGGEPTVLTRPDLEKGEKNHWYPSVLPGGRGVLFTIAVSNRADLAQVAVLDLRTGQPKTLIRGSQAEYVQTGHLLYMAAGTLHAVRFDLERLEVLSDPVPVVDGVWMAGAGAAGYLVSRLGTLAYVPAEGAQTPRSLVWVDRQGHETTVAAPLRAYTEARLSPDGTRVALAINDQEHDIYIWDLRQQGPLRRLTFDPNVDNRPVWTPDGRRIVFASQRPDAFNLFAQAADGTGAVERLTTGAYAQAPAFVAPDGTGVLGSEQSPKTHGNVVWFPLKSAPSPSGSGPPSGSIPSPVEPLVRTTFIEANPALSPDGRYLAYQSDESGPNEIYVRPFPRVNDGRWQISTGGGTRPAWARNGRELFYLDVANVLTAVPVQASGSTFGAGNPARVLETAYAEPLAYSSRPFDVSPDGQRFLMIKENAAGDRNATPAGIVVVQNWFEELKAKVQAAK